MGKYSHTHVTQALRLLVDEHGIERTDLAEALGVTRSRLRTLINGDRYPNDAEIAKLDTWLQKTPPRLGYSFATIREQDAPLPQTLSLEELSPLPFGRQFQAMRKACDFTRETLGEHIGSAAETIKDWEQGNKRKAHHSPARPQEETLNKAIECFKERNSELITEEIEQMLRDKYAEIGEKRRTSLGAVSKDVSLGKAKDAPERGK